METMQRTKYPKKWIFQKAVENPFIVVREICNRSLFEFIVFFWSEYSSEEFKPNWHIKLLCTELEKLATNVALQKPKENDLIINIPPGTTKTAVCSIFFPLWCWTKWYWMKFITCGYSATLSMEAAEYSRDVMRSEKFCAIYPELEIKEDKDRINNFRVIKKIQRFPGSASRVYHGGNRYSTSVSGTLTGFHAHIIIVDDPISPHQAISETELLKTNRWIDQTLPTRKVEKAICPTVMVMQRLHENDPSGHILSKKKKTTKHICLPGEIRNHKNVNPPELAQYYINDLLDPIRLGWKVLKELEEDLGVQGYAGQVGQDPTPPKGGLFKVDRFNAIQTPPLWANVDAIVRAWDKAGTTVPETGTKQKEPAYTVGTKIARLKNGRFVIMHVKRGRWSPEDREDIIKATAEADGQHVKIYHEQEPGSGGKESAEATIRNLAGFYSEADLPRGDKTHRAGPYAVQVNNGNVDILIGEWNHDFIHEHRYFPFSRFKDQVDSAALGFAKLVGKKKARSIR